MLILNPSDIESSDVRSSGNATTHNVWEDIFHLPTHPFFNNMCFMFIYEIFSSFITSQLQTGCF